MASKRTTKTQKYQKPETHWIVTAADGTEYGCLGSDIGEMLHALPGWLGFRRVA